MGGSENHVRRVCGVLGGEDAENVPFRGEASSEIAAGLRLGGHRSSIHEGDFKFFQFGSTLRSRFGKFPLRSLLDMTTDPTITAFRITKGVMITCMTFV